MFVSDRQQMAKLLEERMTRTYSSLSEKQKLESDTSLIKTHLLESHLPEEADFEQASKYIRGVFSEEMFKKAKAPLLTFADNEEGLLTVETEFKHEHASLYLDYSNPRFWILHSTASSNTLKYIIDRMTKSGPEVDRVWIPSEMLDLLSKFGSFRGLGLDFDRSWLASNEEDDSPSIDSLKMQLWGNKARDVLDLLERQDAFPDVTTLSKITIKYYLSDKSREEFSLDSIKYNGKITSRGTSFQCHITLVTKLLNDYAFNVTNMEKNYAIKYHTHNGQTVLNGEPLNFILNKGIENLEVFCNRLFSCGDPFRLWGIPIKIGPEFYRIRAVDLHVGSPIDFEISPEFIRVYLPEGSCGNSVIRLYTNFQHCFDSNIQLIDGDGKSVIQFQSSND